MTSLSPQKLPFKLAIASGKGGTGKTTLAVALAQSYVGSLQLIDSDVEEPNCHLFFGQSVQKTEFEVEVGLPSVDAESCRGCGICVKFCQYNAMATIKNKVHIFPDLCHSCGGCVMICPSKAIKERASRVGLIEEWHDLPFFFLRGLLDIGRLNATQVIRALKKRISPQVEVVIIDGPPGTSCPMASAVEGVDYVLLVAEPTPFGCHDLDLAVRTLRKMQLPFGVVLNKADPRVSIIDDYCCKEGIPLHLKIPDDLYIAEASSRGDGLLSARPFYRELCNSLIQKLAQGYSKVQR